ncbi:MAG: GIY-YIG nuclease family protein [Candidatus Diapherotrites archaeon]|nr:GIY-YIG nuclease family protein [Candidatus Diapherotrites archaeon]
MHFVYLLQCRDGTLYCGYTHNLQKRLQAHQEGKGAKYTRGRRPLKLVYSKKFLSRPAAMRREAQIKRLSRAQKKALIQNP